MRTLVFPLAVLVLGLCGCGDSSESNGAEPTTWQNDAERARAWPPEPTDPALLAGMQVWSADCRLCHLIGLEGSPALGDREGWAPRIAKGVDVLYRNAIDGWLSPSLAEMPARGGNDELSDAEVQSAVDYMVWAATEAPPKPAKR